MSSNSSVTLDNQKELLVEVCNAEKQLWLLIHSKGLLHTDVKDLYRKIRTKYEKIILVDDQIEELHNVEYSLWKLHYKHIDEFRKQLRKSSANADCTKLAISHDVADLQDSNNAHLEEFKLFLAEATEFYKDLIMKIRQRPELLEEPLFHKNDNISSSIIGVKLYKFACHRFLVCLGDLARYEEFYGKPSTCSRNWSVAATYYLEATRIWPDSGNPQNQLALLATYVGDEFLALYHCLRSLAIREPFPDAWDNLVLLLEKNRSSHLSCLSSEAHFDFFEPTKRSSMRKAKSAQTEFWLLIVRMISFFYIKSRLEDFNCTFASTMKELEALVALDDAKLQDSLESYQHMESIRMGPFRAVQVASVLIFINEDLMKRKEVKETKNSTGIQQPVLEKLALAASFICMARLVDRCSKAYPVRYCPLLSSLLIFLEWLVGMLDKFEPFRDDEESLSAMSYFFGSLANLLNQFKDNRGEDFSPECTALWEDCELLGFEPLAVAYEALDFSAHQEYRHDFDIGSICRINRIIAIVKKIVNIPSDSQKWISYDEIGKKFYLPGSKTLIVETDLEVKSESDSRATEQDEKLIVEEDLINPNSNVKPVLVEEEEVILFKPIAPIARYNSAPICTSITTSGQMPPQPGGIGSIASPSEESLRRASSLFIASDQARIDHVTSLSGKSNFRGNKLSQEQEPASRDSTAYSFAEGPSSARPPSLSAWVLNRGSVSTGRGKVVGELHKQGPNPVEGSSVSLTALSISGIKDVASDSGQNTASAYFSSPYSAPIPSAPLLPEDAFWYSGDSYDYPSDKGSGVISGGDPRLITSQASNYSNWNATHGIPYPSDRYPPLIGLTNTFERFHLYQNDDNLGWADNVKWPGYYSPAENLRNFYNPDASRFGLFDRWGSPLASNSMIYLENQPAYPGFPPVYGADEEIREKIFTGLPKPSPYNFRPLTDLRAEQQPLLKHLKEKEWQLQREQQMGGPTFIGN